MSLFTLLDIRTLVRTEINESSNFISDIDLNSIINDGYRDVAVKGLCCENKIQISNIPAYTNIIDISGNNIIRVTKVEFDFGSGCLGMKEVAPQTIGHVTIDGYSPQFWFQWGTSLIIDPPPILGTYNINIYSACYPNTIMSLDGDMPVAIPLSFYECVYLYTISLVELKLKRWTMAAIKYNIYIDSIQKKKNEFILRRSDSRSKHDMPMSVEKINNE
jgi:hypothetical protein